MRIIILVVEGSRNISGDSSCSSVVTVVEVVVIVLVLQ